MSLGNGDTSWDGYRRYVIGKLGEHDEGIRVNRQKIDGLKEQMSTMEKRLIGWIGAMIGVGTILTNLKHIEHFVRAVVN